MNIADVNWKICDKLSQKLTKKKIKHKIKSRDDGWKILDLDRYNCFLRIFFGDEIGVGVYIKSVNADDEKLWVFASGINEIEGESLNDYKKVALKYLEKMAFLWDNMTFAPEWHRDMIPHNFDDIVALVGESHWSTAYEKIMMFPCSYNKREELDKWLAIVSDRKFANGIYKL